MQRKLRSRDMCIVVEMVDPIGIEEARPPQKAVHFITVLQQQFGEICAVLPSDTRNQCTFFHIYLTYSLPNHNIGRHTTNTALTELKRISGGRSCHRDAMQ